MVASGTTDFNLNIEELVEEAYDLIGGEMTSGEDLSKGRRALNLVLIDLQNRGHPLAKLENLKFQTVKGESSYELPKNILDVMDVVLSRGDSDTAVQRIPLFEYHKIANKDSEGLPTQFAIDRDTSRAKMFLYLTPENSTDFIDMWVVRRIQDAGPYNRTLDMSYRYLPAIVHGLAYYLSRRREGISMAERNALKTDYVETLTNAFLEDTERTSYKVSPYPYHRRK